MMIKKLRSVKKGVDISLQQYKNTQNISSIFIANVQYFIFNIYDFNVVNKKFRNYLDVDFWIYQESQPQLWCPATWENNY